MPDVEQAPPSDRAGDSQEAPGSLRERALSLSHARLRTWAIGSCIALVIGSIAPWATASYLGLSASAGGLQGGGWVTLITGSFGVIAIVNPEWLGRAPWLRPRRMGTWLALLALSVLVCLLNFSSVENPGLAGVVHPGWGLWIAFLSALVGIGTAYVIRVQARQSSLESDRAISHGP